MHILCIATAKSLQSCPTLCDPIDGSPPGSPVLGILQARTLEWVAIYFSNAWKWKVNGKSLSRVWLLATPWTAAYQAPPSMGFSRQEYWSGVWKFKIKQLFFIWRDFIVNRLSFFFKFKAKTFSLLMGAFEFCSCIFAWNMHWFCVSSCFFVRKNEKLW